MITLAHAAHAPAIDFSPADRAFTESLRATYGSYLVVLPTAISLHPQSTPARLHASRWQGVIAQLAARRTHAVLQPWAEDSEVFAGAAAIPVDSFIDACAMVAGASAFCGMEGPLATIARLLEIPTIAVEMIDDRPAAMIVQSVVTELQQQRR